MWDIILAERAKRSIILTTHFLDEGDVLADHIVILSKGRIKCQGTGAELKTRFGEGYRVHVPRTECVGELDPPTEVHQDRVIYRTEDSRSAARLVTQLELAGHKEVQMAGPTIEDVFLNVTKDDMSSDTTETGPGSSGDHEGKQLSSGHRTSFWTQVRVLLRKRLTILPRYWISTLLALVLPIVCVPAINTFITKDFTRPGCKPEQVWGDSSNELKLSSFYYSSSWSSTTGMPFGPRSVNESLFSVLRDYPIGVNAFNISQYDQQISIVDDYAAFQQYISANNATLYQGGLYMGDGEAAPLLVSYGGLSSDTQVLLSIWTQVRSKVPIAVLQGSMNSYFYLVSPLYNLALLRKKGRT